MPSYKKSLILCSLLLFFGGCNNKTLVIENKEPIKIKFVEVKTKSFDLENQYIILALEFENQRLYYDAREIYFKLFEKTNNYEYFAKFIAISIHLRDFELVKNSVPNYYLENIKEEELILR